MTTPEVINRVLAAPDLRSVMQAVRDSARVLLDADGVTFVLREGDYCHYADENAIGPLWKGRRFPMHTCISGWVMAHGQPAVIPDIYADPRIPAEAYRPTFVKSLAMVPVGRAALVAAIGAYWATPHAATADEVARLEAMANAAAVVLDRTCRRCHVHGELHVMHRIEPRGHLREFRCRACGFNWEHLDSDVLTA